MLRTIAIIWGALFIVVGIAGFVPAMTPEGHLLGVFHVNAAHNTFHILTGIVAILCGWMSLRATRYYFGAFGAVYLLVAVLGFIDVDGEILGVIANNPADAWLHLAVGSVAVILALAPEPRPIPRPA